MAAPGPNSDPIPASDTLLAYFATNFAGVWSPATFNTTVPLAADIVSATNNFGNALLLATDPMTRTPTTVQLKNQARTALVALLRPAIRSAVTAYRAGAALASDLTALGVRTPDLTKTQIPPPADAPQLDFTGSAPGKIQYRVTQVVGGVPVTDRVFPYGIMGVRLLEKWGTNERVTTVKRVNIVSLTNGIAAGTVITASACYFTARGEVGPQCPEIQAIVS
jgi:hypothetical protein